MIDQIAIQLRKDHIRERSQLVATAYFRQRSDSSAQTPTNVYYRLDDLTSGCQILDWTSATAGETATITITPTQNAMRDQCRTKEVRQLTVAADYGLSTQFVDSIEYEIENLQGITT
jgi:hypothetical protein